MTTPWDDLIDSLREDQKELLENMSVAIAEAMATSKPVILMVSETKKTVSLYMSFHKKEDIRSAADSCMSLLMDMVSTAPGSRLEH